MTTVRILRWAMAGVLGTLLLPAACGSSGVVGGECLPEYSKCGGECVNVKSNVSHCGVCGKQCGSGFSCANGVCVPGGVGGAAAGAAGDTASGGLGIAGAGAQPAGGSAGQGGTSQGGSIGIGGDATGGTGDTGGVAGQAGAPPCLPPHDEPSHCGSCDIQCVPPEPYCAPDPSSERGYECVPACNEPYTECAGRCVDLRSDPENCGRCGNICVSGICQDSQCVGAKQGHVVMVCMNYLNVRRDSSHAILLGNAIFYRNARRLRILAYTEYAPLAERNKVNAVIGWEANSRARNYEIQTVTKSSDITTRLINANFEVFLVYDQPSAPNSTLASIGTTWATTKSVQNFAKAGGVVVILGSAKGTAEMEQLLTQSGLLAVSDMPAITDDTKRFYNRAPADAIVANVDFPFVAVPDACTFTTSATPAADLNFVATDDPGPALGNALVIHRVFAP